MKIKRSDGKGKQQRETGERERERERSLLANLCVTLYPDIFVAKFFVVV